MQVSSPAGVIFHSSAFFCIGSRHTHASKHLSPLLPSHQKGATCEDCNLCLRSESDSASVAYDFSYVLTWSLQEIQTPHFCAMRSSFLRYELVHNCAEALRSVEVSCALFNSSLILHKASHVHFLLKGTWCSGITSASHAEGPGFKSQCVHFAIAPCSQLLHRNRNSRGAKKFQM